MRWNLLRLYPLFFCILQQESRVAEWVRRWRRKWKVPGSNPASLNFFLLFLAHAPIFFAVFCVNSTHALTHASNLRKCAKSYNARKFDAQSAHVARLRRYCANYRVAQFRRKIGAFWVIGYVEDRLHNWISPKKNWWQSFPPKKKFLRRPSFPSSAQQVELFSIKIFPLPWQK